MSTVPTPVEITPERLNWLAGHVGFELGNAVARIVDGRPGFFRHTGVSRAENRLAGGASGFELPFRFLVQYNSSVE